MSTADDRDPSTPSVPALQPEHDPILIRRARVARLCDVAQRGGYGLFGLAIVAFTVGAVHGFTPTLVRIITAAMVAGSVILAPAIVFGYAVKAAAREDRERSQAPSARRTTPPPPP